MRGDQGKLPASERLVVPVQPFVEEEQLPPDHEAFARLLQECDAAVKEGLEYLKRQSEQRKAHRVRFNGD